MLAAGTGSRWRNKVLKDTAMLNVAAVIAQLASVGQSLIVMRLLGPATYGTWLGLSILLTYGGLAHFGSEHGLGIRLPYLRGKRQMARAEAMTDSVFMVWTASTLLLSVAIVIYAMTWAKVSFLTRQGLFAIALLLPLYQQAAFYSRWRGAALTDFRLSSILSVVQSWASLIFVVPLVALLGLRGLMIGSVAASLLVMLAWIRESGYDFRGRWSLRLYWQTIRVGLPMTLVVLGGGLVQTTDRVVILWLLGATPLGYYGVTSLGGGLVYALIAQAGSAMGPHITLEMARSGDTPQSLERFLVAPTIAFAYVASFAIALVIIVIPVFVRFLLPNYTKGLTPFLIFVPGFYFLSIILTANTILTLILIARRKQRLVLYVQGAAILSEAVLAFAFIKAGLGLNGAALASTIAYALYGLGILILAATYVLHRRPAILGFIGRVLTPAIVVFPLILTVRLVTERFISDNPVASAAIQLVALAVIAAALFRTLDRQVPIRALATEARATLRNRRVPRA